MVRFCSRYVKPRIRLLRVPKGTPGTLATARLIGGLIRDGAKDFYVRQKAIEIFRAYRVPAKDKLGEVWALFDWVRRNVRYTRDIFQVELLHTARRLLELKAGDCDDFSILLGSMLVSTGHPVRLALVGFRPHKPHAYSHIYLEVQLGRRWIPLDATMERPMGSAPPALWKRVCELGKEGLRCSASAC
jgi:transglutaminase-like putative cysteine protease